MYFSATINYDGGNLRVSKKQCEGSGKNSGLVVEETVERGKGSGEWKGVVKAVERNSGECERQWEKQWRVRKAVVRGGETVESAKGSG